MTQELQPATNGRLHERVGPKTAKAAGEIGVKKNLMKLKNISLKVGYKWNTFCTQGHTRVTQALRPSSLSLIVSDTDSPRGGKDMTAP